jgi:UDP-N-acetylglucosamine 2-epimerase
MGAAGKGDVVFPVHPRTQPLIDFELPVNVHITDPFSYKELLTWMSRADHVVTDSGGVQREAYWMGVPFTLERDSTSWPETLFPGNRFEFGDGRAAYKIMEILANA